MMKEEGMSHKKKKQGYKARHMLWGSGWFLLKKALSVFVLAHGGLGDSKLICYSFCALRD